jgi:hypothetical protein
MNASTQSTLNARNPQYTFSRTPRIIAAVAAIVVTIVLFDGVALLGGRDDGRATAAASGTVVAQSTAIAAESTAR